MRIKAQKGPAPAVIEPAETFSKDVEEPWMGKEQIAESLSQVALTEIIGVVLVYAVKSVFENLSKNNSWPDKPGSDLPDGVE